MSIYVGTNNNKKEITSVYCNKDKKEVIEAYVSKVGGGGKSSILS